MGAEAVFTQLLDRLWSENSAIVLHTTHTKHTLSTHALTNPKVSKKATKLLCKVTGNVLANPGTVAVGTRGAHELVGGVL